MRETLLEVQPSGRGEVVSWLAFRAGRFEEAGLGRVLGLTTMLTDAVDLMWSVCREVDPGCQRVVRVPNGFLSTYFKIEFRSDGFVVSAERRLARGAFPLNPLGAEAAANYNVTLEVRSDDPEIVRRIAGRFRDLAAGRIPILREA